MIPIICFVGASNVGKTTHLERLIPELRGRGYRVGVVKHDAHSFTMDREGKDTWRLRQAGADTVAISSAEKVAMIRGTDAEMDLEMMASRLFWNEDLLLTEGFKRSRFPKIEIFRASVEKTPICTPGDNLVGLVTDDPLQADIPVFRFAEVTKLADFIEERYLKGRKRTKATVHLDGKQLPVNDFVREFLGAGIVGMLSTLRGWKSPRTIDIHLRTGDE
ncbi:MAG: molybdopterin-guanine dinucleotide biosynthesis protein B [Deltaproteobacteria bacterium]|nr:molybdopterin-guanine dinucleotide biosynthesis protein B [Deltaproteobacteria bacterium]